MLKSILQNLPYNGANPFAKSAALVISPKGIEAAETMIAIETNPPKIIEMIVSFLANDKSSVLSIVLLPKKHVKTNYMVLL